MDFVQALVNYGAMGICLAYFIWKDNTTMKEFRDTLTDFKETITILKIEIENRNNKND